MKQTPLPTSTPIANWRESFAGPGTVEADAAIREARAGKLEVTRMLHLLLKAQAFVPLDSEPSFEGNRIKAWKPATVTSATNGSQFVVAFTDEAVATSFCKANDVFGDGLLVECAWLLEALQSNHGILFNPGGSSEFEWSASGIRAFREQHAEGPGTHEA